MRGGVDIVQIREKTLADGELARARSQQARELTRRLGVPLVVNDRPDLARLAEADYVHVGQDDLPVEAARAFGVGVGQSTHAPPELDAHGGRLRGRRACVRDADEGGTAGRRARRTFATPRLMPAYRGSRSAASTRRRSRDVVAAGATSRSPSSARSATRPTPKRAAAALRRALCPRAAPLPCRSQFGSRSPVAQLAEHPAVNRRVVGSSPTRGVFGQAAIRKPHG